VRSLLSRVARASCSFIVALAACVGGDAVLGPYAPSARLSLAPVFQSGPTADPLGIVDARVVLLRADGSVALDTVVAFPAGADSIALALDVQLNLTAPPSGESFELTFELRNASGTVVFRGGPTTVLLRQGTSPPPVPVPVSFVGPGAQATRIEIAPPSRAVEPEGTVSFVATAFDASGQPVPGAAIRWISSDPVLARIVDPARGDVVIGTGTGDAVITARLPNEVSATANVQVRLVAAALARVGTDVPACTVGTPLAAPFQVLVTSASGRPVPGVAVAFRVVSGGGTLGASTVMTGADGTATASYVAGPSSGSVLLEASAGQLTGSPVQLSFACLAGAPARVVFASQPADVQLGAPIPAFVVRVEDSFGNLAAAQAGTVQIDVAQPAGLPLGGVTSAPLANGVAVFGSVVPGEAAPQVRLRARLLNSDIEPALSAAFAVTAPPVVSTGRIAGTVVDARTAAAIAGASVSVFGADGVELSSVTTGPNGQFVLDEVPVGAASVVVSATGYSSAEREVEVLADQTVTVQVALSGTQLAGVMSIVLQWGAEPRDLDSYLWLPSGGNPIAYFNAGSCSAAPFACLDRDDTDGFGPETITISQLGSGTFTYAVNIFGGTGTFASSPATVTVFIGNQQVATFTAPAGNGVWWTVFNIVNGAVVPVGTVGDAPVLPQQSGGSLRSSVLSRPPKRDR
jgi:hypothetical protein